MTASSIMLLSLVTFLFYFSVSLQRPFVPIFMGEGLNASILEVGYMASALGLTGLLLAVPAGFFSDKIGRRMPVALGAAVWAASLVGIAASTEPIHVIWSYAAAGVGMVLFDSSLSAFVGDVAPSNRFGRAYGVYNAAIQMGFAFGPAAGAMLVLGTGYRNSFLAAAVFPIVASFLVFASRSLRNGDPVETSASSKPLRTAGNFRSRTLWIGWISIFCLSILVGGVSVLVPLYARFEAFSEVFIGVLFTVQSITGAFGRFPFGRLIDTAGGSTRLTALGLLVTALCTAGFAVSSSWMWLILMMGGFGLGSALTFMSTSVSIARETSNLNRGLAMGFASLFRFGGFTVGPWIGSVVASSQTNLEVGYIFGFLSLAATSLISVFLITVLEGFRRHRDAV